MPRCFATTLSNFCTVTFVDSPHIETRQSLTLIQTRDGSNASEFPLTSSVYNEFQFVMYLTLSVYNSFKLVTDPVFLELICFVPFGGDKLQGFQCESSFGCAKFGEVTHARGCSRRDDNNKFTFARSTCDGQSEKPFICPVGDDLVPQPSFPL